MTIESVFTEGTFGAEISQTDVYSGRERLNVLHAGAGPAVLMLHGFPDSSALWRHQVQPLVDAGFQLIIPDLRGFGASSKPQDVADYTPAKLLNDLICILHAFEVKRAHVVGHDFGAYLAWMLASLMPRRVDHLVAISVAHPSVWRNPTFEQRERFWYSLFYLLPEAEQLIRQRNWQFLRDGFKGEKESERYLRDLMRPKALTAGLNWYRANSHPARELEPERLMPAVEAPTLAIWSTGDSRLTEKAMLDSEQYVKGPWRYESVDCGHFVPTDIPDQVSGLLLDFLGSHDTASRAPNQRRRL